MGVPLEARTSKKRVTFVQSAATYKLYTTIVYNVHGMSISAEARRTPTLASDSLRLCG